jgi:biotin carboxyl carrier protein
MGKPPPFRVVPQRSGSDYDEEDATTLDPFAIHDSELVKVPKSGTTEDMREDLKADPDVQDALRWLDPPSNAGPPAAAAAAAGVDPYAPPVRPPSAPVYPQMYTPVPQPYPGAGPYPTPVPAFVPNTGQYYLTTPMPGTMPPGVMPPGLMPPGTMPSQMVPAPAARSPILWIILTALVTGGGIALGWWMFAGRSERASAKSAAPVQPVAPQPVAPQPVAPQPVAPQPVAPQPTPTPPPPTPTEPPPKEPAVESVTAQIVSIAPSSSLEVAAPAAGTVSKVFLAAPGKVAKGDKLLEIRSDGGGGAKAKKLAARVAELEQLAKDDPVYEEFLADARKAERAARGSPKVTAIKAPSEGRAQVDVKEGEAIARGKTLARISSGSDWIVKATAKAEVLRSWGCSLVLPGGERAPCKIDKVVASASGSDITATVSGKDAPWLEGAAQNPTLVLDPP